MEMNIKEKFSELWKKYFDGAELPITFYYTNEEGHAELVAPDSVPRCVILALSSVRKGSSLCFNAQSIGCFGGKRFLGFTKKVMDKIEYFLSCGIPGKFEGERYKKSPELAEESQKHVPSFKAPAQFIVFKRWDRLEASDNPEVIIFFAQPDVLSGLCTLTSFDEAEPNSVFSPHGSGCSSIVTYPYAEIDSSRPRAVIGMFDPSARPHVPKDKLAFSVPMKKFVRMIDNMDTSFLITETWQKVQKRIS
nr:DUF169 domain-containing protein [Candidatus Njordarchaeum guaymaensis]